MKTEEAKEVLEANVTVLGSEQAGSRVPENEDQLQAMAENPYLGQTFDLNSTVDMLPDLHSGVELPLDLASGYWSPETPGESKLVLFDKLQIVDVLSSYTAVPEIVPLQCAFFVEQTEEGEYRSIRSASTMLVGIMIANKVKRGTAFKITFNGKQKNKTNRNESSRWSVKPIVIKTIAI